MDSVSQLVLGAACGEAVLGRKIGNKALLWGAVGGTIPDLDVILSPFFGPVDALFVHRGFSHSLLFPVLLAPLLGVLFVKIFKSLEVSWKEWASLFFWSIITHPLLDALTGYGTGLFEPFHEHRVDISCIFIVDPLYTIPFLLCIIGVIRAGREWKKRAQWNKIGLIMSTGYLAITFLSQQAMQAGLRKELMGKGHSIQKMMTIPTPFNCILWATVADAGPGYYVGYRSWLDSGPTHFQYFPKNDSLIDAFRDQKDIRNLIRFSKGYYTITIKDERMYFNDIRFAQMAGWVDPQADFVFSFEIVRKPDGFAEVRKGEWRSSRMSGLGSLWSRILGKS